MPPISLVIPCFNAAPFLEAALASVRSQTRPPDEIIVVDDGSTDGSAAIAKGVAGVRVIRTAHGGIAAARNAGIAAASGEVIAFLDADDLWTPDSLATRIALSEQRPDLDYVFGSVLCFDDRTGADIGVPEPARLAGSLLLRRNAFDAVGLFDTGLRTGETIDWIARADTAGYRSGAAPGIVLRRRVHTRNTTRGADSLAADYLKVLRRNLARRS